MSSLAATALRLCARRLIEGRTFAGARVFDSAIAQVNDMVSEGATEPFIIISTEDEDASDLGGRDVNSGHVSVDLVIEVAISQAVAAESGDPAVEYVIPATDAGMEVSLALILRQISRALFEQPGDPWGALFQTVCTKVDKISNRRGVGNKEGARFAARQVIYTVQVLHEPSFGDTLDGEGFWVDFVAQLNADPELSAITPLFVQAITGSPVIEAWDRDRSDQGLRVSAAADLALRMPTLPDEEPPLTNEADVIEVTDEGS